MLSCLNAYSNWWKQLVSKQFTPRVLTIRKKRGFKCVQSKNHWKRAIFWWTICYIFRVVWIKLLAVSFCCNQIKRYFVSKQQRFLPSRTRTKQACEIHTGRLWLEFWIKFNIWNIYTFFRSTRAWNDDFSSCFCRPVLLSSHLQWKFWSGSSHLEQVKWPSLVWLSLSPGLTILSALADLHVP